MPKVRCPSCRKAVVVVATDRYCPHCVSWSYEQCPRCRGRKLVGKGNPIRCPDCRGQGVRYREVKVNLETGQRERFIDGRSALPSEP